MIKALLFDFSRVLLFPLDELYRGELNKLYRELASGEGYCFLDTFALDPRMIEYLKSIKDKYKLYVYTSGSIQDAPEIRPVLDSIFMKIYTAGQLGIPKHYPLAYKEIAKDIGIAEGEIVFIDDTQANIDAAVEAGCRGLLYTGFQ